MMSLNLVGAGISGAAAIGTAPIASIATGGTGGDFLTTIVGPLGALVLMWWFLQGELSERKRLTARAETGSDALLRIAEDASGALKTNAEALKQFSHTLERITEKEK
jgi:hypothetical protein